MADTLKARMEALKNNRSPAGRMAINDCIALLDEHCGDRCTHHAALKRCVEALENGVPYIESAITCAWPGQKFEDFNWLQSIKQTLAELKEIL